VGEDCRDEERALRGADARLLHGAAAGRAGVELAAEFDRHACDLHPFLVINHQRYAAGVAPSEAAAKSALTRLLSAYRTPAGKV
jgi:hypothetical protein